MEQIIRKSSAQIIAELDELTKDEVKDNRKTLTDKESYELLLYGILDRTKQDLELDSSKFTDHDTAKNIEQSDHKSKLDAIKYIDDGRLDEVLYLIDPYLDTRKIKDEFRKRIK